MDVRYQGVGKVFSGIPAIDLDLEVPDGKFLALLGPSGCGKTTALRMLAGLEEPTSGQVFIGEDDVTKLQPRDRDVAMVFQSYALYPHKNVAENIAYPLRVRKIDKARTRAAGRQGGRAAVDQAARAGCRGSCPAASGSGSPWPARSCASRGRF